MKAVSLLFAALTLAAPAVLAADPPKDKDGEHVRFEPFTPEEKTSEGSVTIGGRSGFLEGRRPYGAPQERPGIHPG